MLMSGREVTARTTIARDQTACTPADLDAVRFEVARADVLAQVAMEHFDRTNWREVDDARVDFVAHLVAAASGATSVALLAMDDLRRAVVRRAAVPSGEVWSDG
jgi:hypothetical protein